MRQVTPLEKACQVYAKATDYYTEFHSDLYTPSSIRITNGLRAVLDALGYAQAMALLDPAMSLLQNVIRLQHRNKSLTTALMKINDIAEDAETKRIIRTAFRTEEMPDE